MRDETNIFVLKNSEMFSITPILKTAIKLGSGRYKTYHEDGPLKIPEACTHKPEVFDLHQHNNQ